MTPLTVPVETNVIVPLRATFAGFTVTDELAVKLPSVVLTVTEAVPTPTPVIKPDVVTLATPESLVDQVTAELVALDGETVAVSCWVSPTEIVAVVGATETPVTETVAAFTDTVELDMKLPSIVVALTVAVPEPTPVTNPVVLTVAIPELLVDQVTAELVALDGAIVAVSCCVPPTEIVAVAGVTATPVTETVDVPVGLVQPKTQSNDSTTALTSYLTTSLRYGITEVEKISANEK